MHRRFLIPFAAFWVCVAVYALVLARRSPVAASPEIAAAAVEPVHDEEAHQTEVADYAKQAQTQLQGLARVETKRTLRDAAARHTYEARSQLQRVRAEVWLSVLSTNQQAFDVLRHQCEKSPSGEAPCTICIGNGVMPFCVLCENIGKCPSCAGSGRGYLTATCPTCLGDGKCYLCSGAGRMMCLYCDDGIASRKLPLPPLALPVRWDPPPAQEIVSAQPYGFPAGSPLHKGASSQSAETGAARPVVASDDSGLLMAILLLVGAGLGVLKIVVVLNKRRDPWATTAAAAAYSSLKLRTEEVVLSEFIQTFKTGPTGRPEGSPLTPTSPAEREQVKEFFARVPDILGELRKVLQRINATTDESARRVLLTDLFRELRILKDAATHPELLTVWQVTAALEGLVKQLTDKVTYLTPSTFRTVAGAVDFLRELCVPGVRPDLFTNPPIRLLAVDDDPICRKVVAFSLKKALNQPDLAEDGEAALALASKQAYDVIFLDVMMPGMDGFEVCKRIHQTIPNATTPVVFVTICGDFEGRAKAIVSGGSHLIAKPFLTFEITVKALTYARQRELASSAANRRALQPARNGSATHSPNGAEGSRAQNQVREANEDLAVGDLSEMLTDNQSQSQLFSGNTPASELAPGEPTRAWLARASAQLVALQDLLQDMLQTSDEEAQRRPLSDFSFRLRNLSSSGDSATGHPTVRLIAAMEGLVKKLLEQPKHCTASTFLTLGTALDLLRDLCATRVPADLAVNPPIRMLVVDEDPVARRAITGVLQMAFEKPESADSGEAALSLATAKPFDVIFMDVQMPGMGGFTACLKILETEQNRTTPVVFVTNDSDFEARAQATTSGGSDFVAKPFLTAEMTLKALTYALRGRLQKLDPEPPVPLLFEEEAAQPDNRVPAFA